MALRNRELHARNDDDDIVKLELRRMWVSCQRASKAVSFEVVPKTSKRRTSTSILQERVPGGGSRNTKST